jgi:ABC-type uncharacterized transport system auxiliary subunit
MKKIASIILFAFFLSGCFHAKTVTVQTYMLDLSAPKTTRHRIAEHSIYIAQTSILPQFSGTNFVYHTKNDLYLTDYYHRFFIPPAEQIHQAVFNHFAKGSSINVFDGATTHKINYVLQTKVLALYADYQYPANPVAVMSIQFSLYDLNGKTPALVYKTIFTEKTPLAAKDSDSLMAAWNIDLQKILSHLKYL